MPLALAAPNVLPVVRLYVRRIVLPTVGARVAGLQRVLDERKAGLCRLQEIHPSRAQLSTSRYGFVL